jgi:putative ABC transport system ATP-binding protein
MITIEHCTTTFGAGTPNAVRALDDVSLSIAADEFVVVVGTNGSGKSTLLNAIAGSVIPQSGRIAIDGIDATRMEAHRRARFIGRVFQNPFSGTAPTMTVAENLRLASLRGMPKKLRVGLNRSGMESIRERARELGMGLEDRLETPMGLLSGGQRQALTLLMATLREPRILLLDEHTAALDPKSAEQVIELTNAMIARGRLTALMVTHDMAEAVGYGSRLILMHSGRVGADYAGEAKQRLTAQALLEEFAALRRVPALG